MCGCGTDATLILFLALMEGMLARKVVVDGNSTDEKLFLQYAGYHGTWIKNFVLEMAN